MATSLYIITGICSLISLTLSVVPVARWCVTSKAELEKCSDLKKNLNRLVQEGLKEANMTRLLCQHRKNVFACMEGIQKNESDLMTLDSGQGYFAGKYHNLRPIMAEKYNTVGTNNLRYYGVAVINANNRDISFNNLKNKKACIPGIGMSAGWIYPIATLLEKIEIKECNAIVKSVTGFFNKMCLPGALTSFYNPFGNNPTSVCELCSGIGKDFCSFSDPFAGYDGAFRCLANGIGDIAFLRDNTVQEMTNSSGFQPSDFLLVCPDGRREAVTNYESCNWGVIPSNIVMTAGIKSNKAIVNYKAFLTRVDRYFGAQGKYANRFQLFSSNSYNSYIQKNLMFTDGTQGLEDVGEKDSYYLWVDSTFIRNLEKLNYCPIPIARWCVISKQEKLKCEDMMMAFKAKNLRPELDCILQSSTINCMKLISNGDADLINLEAGDVFYAGKKFGLVPIAAEDYGDMSASFFVVAAARKTDSFLTLFNMKGKRSCHAGVGRADGWIVPVSVYIDTEQFLPTECSAFRNIGKKFTNEESFTFFRNHLSVESVSVVQNGLWSGLMTFLGELFVRACIPGVLDSEYNSKGHPINLCEGCGAGGYQKCQRTNEEQYYGASGAFRCLVEFGGDVAFVRHLTPRDNTDGRNHAIWARNRRSDDYELLCKDGSRTDIDNWSHCHLGRVPANAVVTGHFKSGLEREIFWNMLNYGQQFFSSDSEGDFHLFDSGIYYSDLLFTDNAVRMMRIADENQSFEKWLGPDFVNQVEALKQYTCMPIESTAVSRHYGFRHSIIALISMFTLKTFL